MTADSAPSTKAITSFFGGEGKFEALLKAFVQNRDVMAFVDGAESAVNGDLDRDHLFIQLYGGVQRLSGRRVVEDAVGENTVVRLSTGGLNFVDLQAAPGVGPQVAENAAATAAFSQDLEALGIPKNTRRIATIQTLTYFFLPVSSCRTAREMPRCFPITSLKCNVPLYIRT